LDIWFALVIVINIDPKPMKTLIITFVILLYPLLVFTQLPYQPLVDSSAACIPSYGHFYIVEEMPIPQLPLKEIESVLVQNVRFRKMEFNLKGEIYIQCIVNCKGEPGDYQVAKCPTYLIDIGDQIIKVLRNENFKWKPGKQMGRSVDVFMLIQLEVNKGDFKILALH